MKKTFDAKLAALLLAILIIYSVFQAESASFEPNQGAVFFSRKRMLRKLPLAPPPPKISQVPHYKSPPPPLPPPPPPPPPMQHINRTGPSFRGVRRVSPSPPPPKPNRPQNYFIFPSPPPLPTPLTSPPWIPPPAGMYR
ncbi:hypothetical protein R6Q59_002900 [Mikania micrantha]|uniref:Extensin domain-containing protein n=1 Tax=Mikania micrantha TaxID=192012 RepID=A0A5N6NPQ8_9ASTR|nr:hypothetical protein E3N88_19897 [Mikania micrantha]